MQDTGSTGHDGMLNHCMTHSYAKGNLDKITEAAVYSWNTGKNLLKQKRDMQETAQRKNAPLKASGDKIVNPISSSF